MSINQIINDDFAITKNEFYCMCVFTSGSGYCGGESVMKSALVDNFVFFFSLVVLCHGNLERKIPVGSFSRKNRNNFFPTGVPDIPSPVTADNRLLF